MPPLFFVLSAGNSKVLLREDFEVAAGVDAVARGGLVLKVGHAKHIVFYREMSAVRRLVGCLDGLVERVIARALVGIDFLAVLVYLDEDVIDGTDAIFSHDVGCVMIHHNKHSDGENVSYHPAERVSRSLPKA